MESMNVHRKYGNEVEHFMFGIVVYGPQNS